MIQRVGGESRWKTGSLACCLLASVAVGLLAAQQPPAPPPVQVKVQVGGVIVQGGGIVVGGIQAPAQPNSDHVTTERVKLPVDPRARRKLDDAKRFIDLRDWQSAVKILQSLLDANEDNFLQESDSEKGRRVSVRAEANRLLGSLSKEGKQFYEQEFGPVAKLALRQAKAQSNPQGLADVALRYVHTDAGAEAAALLGSYHLDHGRYIVAALCFERLLNREGGAELSAATLYKAAVAFQRSGDNGNRDKVWNLFLAKWNQPNSKLPTALRSWNEEKLHNALRSNLKERDDAVRSDWLMFMGSPDRTARSSSTAPFLEPRLPPYEPVTLTQAGQARKELEDAAKKLKNLGVPIIPGAHPLVVRHLAIFRALDGLHAFNLKSGQVEWFSTSDASLAAMAASSGPMGDPEMMNLAISYKDTAPIVLTENTLLGTLSSDGELVYAVEDLALPRMNTNGIMWRGGFGNGGGLPQIGNKLADYNGCNHLTAYDIEGGRAVWSIGTRVPEQPFSDTYFLGPPLPIGEKLYVLGETHGEIKLFCLTNRRTPKPGALGEYQYSVDLVWAQPLGIVSQQPITEDPVRRTQAATLSYSDGILVCPTNAGAVIGVDLLTRSLVWAYNYQTESLLNDPEQQNIIMIRRLGGRVPGSSDTSSTANTTQWSYSAPVISGGKVYLAPPDGKALHAINLRDGSLAWTVNRVETGKDAPPPDQYLAGVFDGKVLLVGKQSIRALDANTGKELWRTPVPMPTGRGIANATTYYLPVRNNELLSVSLADGMVTSRAKALQKEQFGNLVLVGDDLVSLNNTHLLVYPVMAVKERQIAERLTKDPNDPIGLVERGELRWHRVGLEAAVADFEQALAHDPTPAVRGKAEAKLAEALLILLDQDFTKQESHFARLRELVMKDPPADAKVEDKEVVQERRSRFLRVAAKGREQQGRIGEALEAYVAFAKLDTKLIPNPEDPQGKVLPRVWARAQAEAMAHRLKPEVGPQLVAAVEKAYEAARAKDAEAMKQFLDLYGGIGRVGRQALLQYAEKLIDQREYTAAQVRLMPLLDSGDANVAARAMDLLARLNVRAGELENAAYYYQLLAKRFPAVPVRDGKTGLQLYQELMNDKRFLPYLDPRRGLADMRDVTVEKMTSVVPATGGRDRFGGGNYAVQLEPGRTVEPALARFELYIHVDMQGTNTSRYVIVDPVTQKEVFSKPSNALPVANSGSLFRQTPTYQPCGPAMVFAWSNRLIAVDPVRQKELWSVNLLGNGDASSYALSGSNTMPHPEMPGRFMVLLPGSRETIGTLGPCSSRCVVATIKDVGLVGLDALTGERIWVQGGVSTHTELFGDEEYVFVLPPRGGQDRPAAYRVQDGHSVPISPDLLHRYQNKLAVRGRHILTKSANGDSLVLFDPLDSTEKWRLALPKGSTVLRDGEGNDVTGYIAPDGEARIVDLASGKELHHVKLAPLNQGETYEHANVVFDNRCGYVFLSKGLTDSDSDGNETRVYPQYQALHSVPVNGPAASFDRESGKVLWQEKLPLQYLVIKRFDELPVLLCSAMAGKSRSVANANGQPRIVIRGGRGGRLEHEVSFFSKETGKALSPIEKPRNEIGYDRSGYGGYYTLTIDPPAGTVGLKSVYRNVVITLKSRTVAAK